MATSRKRSRPLTHEEILRELENVSPSCSQYGSDESDFDFDNDSDSDYKNDSGDSYSSERECDSFDANGDLIDPVVCAAGKFLCSLFSITGTLWKKIEYS